MPDKAPWPSLDVNAWQGVIEKVRPFTDDVGWELKQVLVRFTNDGAGMQRPTTLDCTSQCMVGHFQGPQPIDNTAHTPRHFTGYNVIDRHAVLRKRWIIIENDVIARFVDRPQHRRAIE